MRSPRGAGPVVAALLVLGLLVAGCAAGGKSAGPGARADGAGAPERYSGTEADFAAIRALLQRRAAAVLHHDERGFLATVDDADRGLVARQRTLFANLEALPLRSLSYTVEDVSIPRRRVGAGPQLSPPVVEYAALQGADVRKVSNPLVEIFLRRGHGWLLAADGEHVFNGTTDVQSRPWGHGPVDVARRGATVVVTDAAQDAGQGAGRLLARVTRALATVGAVLGVRAHPHLLVDATRTGLPDQFSPLSHEDAAAVTYPVHQAPRDGVGKDRFAGLVVKVNPRRLGAGLAQYGLLRHELTHVVLYRTGSGLPTWLSEGIADYVAYHPYPESALVVSARVRRHLDRMARHPALPESSQFGYDPAVNYTLSHAAVLWLVDRYGMPRLLRLVRTYHDTARRTGLLPDDGPMLRRVYGITARELARQAFAVTRRLHVA
ncbi:MAG TPA: hypothetical protein VFM09_13420 [Marmoricola sp.]|nr:hypothetical protein [Marmoricola sp.]